MSLARNAMINYVTASDHLQYSNLADGTVQVTITHSNLSITVMELRLDLSSPIAEVKRKLYTHSGSSIEHMVLILKDADGTELAHMVDDERPLGYYGVVNGMRIHVFDSDPYSLSRNGGLEDVSRIKKYRMTDEDYDRRENTLRGYKRKQLAKDPNFRFLPENRKKPGVVDPEAPAPVDPATYLLEECAKGHSVGARVCVTPGERRGVVAFIGTVASLAPGYWIGIQLDEPLGKGDGSRGGVTYFACPDKYGTFVRPEYAAVGDFPPIFEDEEEEGSNSAASAGGSSSNSASSSSATTTTTAVTTSAAETAASPVPTPAELAAAAANMYSEAMEARRAALAAATAASSATTEDGGDDTEDGFKGGYMAYIAAKGATFGGPTAGGPAPPRATLGSVSTNTTGAVGGEGSSSSVATSAATSAAAVTEAMAAAHIGTAGGGASSSSSSSSGGGGGSSASSSSCAKASSAAPAAARTAMRRVGGRRKDDDDDDENDDELF